ncbi:MAG: hypothetical protein ACTHJM_16155 [Marmoricola sp.]
MRLNRKIIAAGIVAAALVTATGCAPAAKTASDNLSQAADNFEINRRIQFINGITDKVFLQIEGRCSIDHTSDQLAVTCKVGDNAYKKHFLGLSNNVTYVAEQLDAAPADPYHYRVIVRPETLIPNIDVQTSGGSK